MSGLHALHKILIEHAHPRPSSVTPGDFLELEPDVFAIGIATTPEFERIDADLTELGVTELPLKKKMFVFLDHGSPAPTAAIAAGNKRWRDFFRGHGIPSTDGGAGISHLIMTEQGVVVPGCIVALRDSHTQTMGAVGCFASSIAGGVLSLFTLGRYWMDVPKVGLFKIDGVPGKGVLGRDVSLHINGRMGQRGALGLAVEFAGSFVGQLGMDLRFTLTNMGTEMGATASYIQPDKITLDWVGPRAKKPFRVFETDADFKYEVVHEFDISKLEPQVAAPHAPDNVKPLGEVEGRHIDQAYLGSCASGRLEDIAAAAAVMKGRKVHPDVRFVITPGSREVLMAATRLGYVDILHQANAIITNANCGACPGLHGGILAPGEVAIACNTRNFEGRMGADAQIYLGSPATVAASAIEGRIADPRNYM